MINIIAKICDVDISEELTTASLYPGYDRIRRSSPEQKSHIDKYQHGILSVSSYGFYHYITLCRFKHKRSLL